MTGVSNGPSSDATCPTCGQLCNDFCSNEWHVLKNRVLSTAVDSACAKGQPITTRSSSAPSTDLDADFAIVLGSIGHEEASDALYRIMALLEARPSSEAAREALGSIREVASDLQGVRAVIFGETGGYWQFFHATADACDTAAQQLLAAIDTLTTATSTQTTAPKNDGWTVCDVCVVNQSCDLGCDFVLASDACFESLAKLLSPRQAELQYATCTPPELVEAADALVDAVNTSRHNLFRLGALGEGEITRAADRYLKAR